MEPILLNTPLLRKVVEWAENEAEVARRTGRSAWHQGWWAMKTDCGTTYCIAGQTVALEGHTIGVHIEECTCSVTSPCGNVFPVDETGEKVDWQETACQLLGISEPWGEALFAGTNRIDDVRRIANKIAEKAGERL